MALTFGGATSDKAQWVIQTPGINLCPLTAWAWIFPTSLPGARGIFSQSSAANAGYRNLALVITGQIEIELDMTTTDVFGRSDTSNQVTTNAWWFVAATITASFVPHVYIGSLTTSVAEVTGYATQTTGVGTPVSDTGGNGRWGNKFAGTLAFPGPIACGAYVSKAMSLAELQALQYWPRRTVETVLYHQLGLPGTGTQPDLTGNGHTATITGAVLGEHVPLPLPFGRGRRVPSYRVAPAAPAYQPWAHGGQDARFAPLIAQ